MLFAAYLLSYIFCLFQAIAASRQMEATGYVETSSKIEEGVTDAFELCGLAAIGSKPRFASLVRRHAPHLKRHIHTPHHRSCSIMWKKDICSTLIFTNLKLTCPQPCCLLSIDTRDCDLMVNCYAHKWTALVFQFSTEEMSHETC